MIHLRSIELKGTITDPGFPFDVPVVRSFTALKFESPVTFFIGENGSGKSTLLETIACAAGSVTVGSESVRTDPTLNHIRKLADRFRLAWNKRTHKGFFLRAEDFFGYAKQILRTRQELEADLAQVDRDYAGRSKLAKDLARMPHAGELHALKNRYGEGLDAGSHGESFLALFQARFVPNGLYLLDEPEAPLSPMRQLAFLSFLKQMTAQDSQFIITTHSSILMAYPEAQILSFDGGAIRSVEYDDLEHVTLTRSFLNDPQAYLRHL